MADQPAPLASLDVIREKLASPTPEVRDVALTHAGMHGTRAVELAPLVAERLADSAGEVTRRAEWAFERIGRGAVAMVPVLRGFLTQRFRM